MSQDDKTGQNSTQAFYRGLTQPRLTRQNFMRGAGAAMMAALAPQIAHAEKVKDWKAWWAKQKPTKDFVFANWPYYIDVTSNGKDHPSLDTFTKDTGIHVKYMEVIQNNAPFYAQIAPVLKSGAPTGYDLIVMTNGWYLTELLMQNFLIPIWKEKVPNFAKYASPAVVNPPYDPGNKHTMVWQSGITGIAYNPKMTKREINSFDDLWDPAFAGHIGMMSDTTELGSAAMLKLGINPTTSTPDDWKKAAAVLKEQKDKGLVRQYYDQSYINALENGDIWITQAWSGDIFQAHSKGYKDLQFVIPKQGAMIWHDNMAIPVGAKNPLSALAWMNYYYTPEAAGVIEDYINYICPVPAAKDYILNVIKDPDVANSPLVFPSASELAKVHEFYPFKSYGDYQTWNNTFNPIIQG
ncbi:polyamine ABC transporter substrate-binding protein [Acidocella aminolytica]|jgi:spermidine/putrescine transport system substrate-binding protein|uniref:ABC transporter polyamine-binding protein PotD n=1 Tax=Acidocella aminolytica 101 = DSM 11237 TaxID=1120923 RepID=A0A0D6PKK0_9PROT|nr:spermidine/putrescine ABC transporter substrate-binding protein [Acidocella aminolytica]GAN81728.1 ABC transporter polyamine-binding protein PotD [Acidocella aminolytica 101 = DSM 11237]GBQ38295.1 spermidine/putrescine-binding periplasmic protein [Acidocella aminolytica 101 = DSM 11237]SHF43939.1 spermidine/putrescine transport system substrate-binding protein [Acidocella aminolytica 101 = DSM 11237]